MLLPAEEVHSNERSQARRCVYTSVVMREMLHPSSEEGRRVPDIGSGMQELSLGLAAVALQPGTEGPEENASTHFPRPASPKGSQMFLVCPFCFTPVGNSAKEAMCQSLTEKCIMSCM